jgi:hypothetical protein
LSGTWSSLHFFIANAESLFNGAEVLGVIMHDWYHAKSRGVMVLQMSTWAWSDIIVI